MKYFLLGAGYTDDNKINQLIIGTYPWSEVKRLDLLQAFDYKDKLENVEMTDNLDLVGTCGDIHRYTSYNTRNSKIKKISLTVLAKAQSYRGTTYFISDGINNPSWMYIDDIVNQVQRKGLGISNATLNLSENSLDAVNKPFLEVDFKQAQLEYRKYLKKMKDKEKNIG